MGPVNDEPVFPESPQEQQRFPRSTRVDVSRPLYVPRWSRLQTFHSCGQRAMALVILRCVFMFVALGLTSLFVRYDVLRSGPAWLPWLIFVSVILDRRRRHRHRHAGAQQADRHDFGRLLRHDRRNAVDLRPVNRAQTTARTGASDVSRPDHRPGWGSSWSTSVSACCCRPRTISVSLFRTSNSRKMSKASSPISSTRAS